MVVFHFDRSGEIALPGKGFLHFVRVADSGRNDKEHLLPRDAGSLSLSGDLLTLLPRDAGSLSLSSREGPSNLPSLEERGARLRRAG